MKTTTKNVDIMLDLAFLCSSFLRKKDVAASEGIMGVSSR
jgi:hypothetical protein